MRDLLVLVLVLAAVPIAFLRPFYGLLLWTAFSYLAPHRFAYGPAAQFPVVFAVAVPTLLGIFLGHERGKLQMSSEIRILLALWVVFTFTTIAAIYPERAWDKWQEVTKILALVFATLMVVQTRRQLKMLYLAIAASIGFFGLKGGIFSIATGGQHRTYGPPGSFLSENNALGMALAMMLPVFVALRKEERRWWVRQAYGAVLFFSVLAILFTYSRGAALGLAIVGIGMWLASRHKIVIGVATAVLIGIGALFIPQRWYDRMSTISAYERDESAMARLNEWTFCWKVALARPVTGGGFRLYSQETYNMYHPFFGKWWDAHSIYFSVLAEHGFIGFGIWIVLWIVVYRGLLTLRRRYRRSPTQGWVATYATMLMIAFAGYLVSGAFLDMAYFEPMYQLVGSIAVLKSVARREDLAARASEPAAPVRAPALPKAPVAAAT